MILLEQEEYFGYMATPHLGSSPAYVDKQIGSSVPKVKGQVEGHLRVVVFV